jgi:predicted glycosyltransferase involved in capsule biosynthesis
LANLQNLDALFTLPQIMFIWKSKNQNTLKNQFRENYVVTFRKKKPHSQTFFDLCRFISKTFRGWIIYVSCIGKFNSKEKFFILLISNIAVLNLPIFSKIFVNFRCIFSLTKRMGSKWKSVAWGENESR